MSIPTMTLGDSNKLVSLLDKTDGRDKLYKFLIGTFQVLSAISSQQGDKNRSYKCTNAANALENARSLLRIGKWFTHYGKLRNLIELFEAQGFEYTERKKFVDFAQNICASIYVLGDCIGLMARYGLLRINKDVLARHTRMAQLWSYILAFVFDLFELRDGLRRIRYDPPAARRAAKRAAYAITRDIADVAVTAPMVFDSCGAPMWHVSQGIYGVLLCLSATASTMLNWSHLK